MLKKNGAGFKEKSDGSIDMGEWIFNLVFPIEKMQRLKREQAWKKNQTNKKLQAAIEELQLHIEDTWKEIEKFFNKTANNNLKKDFRLLIKEKAAGADASDITLRFVDALNKHCR
jgi:hypothetical protein